MDKPTILRLQVSITQQQKTFPSLVGCSVMSTTHSSLRRERAKRRSTRSSLVGMPLTRFVLAGPGRPLDASVVHHEPDQALAHADAVPLDEFSPHPPGSVRPAGIGMDLPDRSGEPLATQHRRRHRPAAIAVVALPGHVQHVADALRGDPGVDEGVDHRVDPFGCWVDPPSIS